MLRMMLLLVMAGLLMTANASDAVRRVRPSGSHAVIGEGTAHRCLFKVQGLDEFGSVAISRAYVEFDVNGSAADRVLYLS
ncbi:hypothetical protein K8I85_11210, partial [bacterium]|nr:hypothetical protein [bacterium]